MTMSSANQTPAQLRAAARDGQFSGQTSGLARGYVQANIVILPKAMAADFKTFCERNPRPCPLLAISGAGEPALDELGPGIDIRTDVSAYRVFRDGVFVEDVTDIQDLWRDDLVTFALGCSFSFEEALMDAAIAVRHVEQGRNVPMYRTTIDTAAAGTFGGQMVVSMRPFASADIERVREITGRFPRVHGAPVHVGAPGDIGIGNIEQPDFGDAVDVYPGEVMAFWACGVTPQVAIERAKPEICITHKPGHMLITDRLNAEFAD